MAKKTPRTRWVCPNGCAAVLGPTRPRRDNICRYCLTCSAKTGKLVERTAPAMQKKAQASTERAQEKAKRKAAAARERAVAKWTVDGVDLISVLHKAMKLPSAKHMRTRPDFTISHSKTKDYSTARAWPRSNRIHVTVGVGERGWVAAGLVLHELAHIACYKAGEDFDDASRSFYKRCHDLHDEWNAKHSTLAEVNVKATGAYRGSRGRHVKDWSLSRTGAVTHEPSADLGVNAGTYLIDAVWDDIEAGLPDGVTVLVRGVLEAELDCRYIDTFDGDEQEQPERAAFIRAWRQGEAIKAGRGRRWRFRLGPGQVRHLQAALQWAIEDWDDNAEARRAAVLLVRQLLVQADQRTTT